MMPPRHRTPWQRWRSAWRRWSLWTLLVVAADVLARNLFSPYELPVGIFTALIGVPCFLWLYGRGGRS